MRLFIGASALIHLVLIISVPASIFEPARSNVASEAPDELSELAILRVMEIAYESFVLSEYGFPSSDKPVLPPEVSIDLAMESMEFPEISPPVPSTAPLSRKADPARGSVAVGRYSPPIPVIVVWPHYPPSARRRGVRGTVVVRVHVTAQGRVDKAEVVSGLEDETCRQAALQASMKLRFLPALLNDRPVEAWFSYPVEFGKRR